METRRFLQILLVGTILVFLNGCAMAPPAGSSALLGTWTNSLGTVLTNKPDGTFDGVTANRKSHVWGTYTVTGDTVTFHGTGGNTPKGCDGPGVYHYTRATDGTLQFKVVKDACEPRMRNLAVAWHQK